MPILHHLTAIQAIAKATDQTLDTLRSLAIQFSAMHKFAHQAHHETEGQTFYQDHDEFGILYPLYESIYDGLVERVKGLGGKIDLRATQASAVDLSNSRLNGKATAEDFFAGLLAWERGVCGMIDVAVKEPTMDEGVRNLLCGIIDDSQKDRQYKMGQRLGGGVAKCGRPTLSLRHPTPLEKVESYLDDQREDAAKDVEYPEILEKAGKTMTTFGDNFTQLGAFAANIGKAGKGWFHGNQVVPGSKSAKAEAYAGKMKEAKAAAKGGSALQAKAAEYEAMNHWRKMAPGERGHAMQLLNDSASEDIGKSQDRGFEFGHGRKKKM